MNGTHSMSEDQGPFGLALLLAGLAGWVDAIGLAGSGTCSSLS